MTGMDIRKTNQESGVGLVWLGSTRLDSYFWVMFDDCLAKGVQIGEPPPNIDQRLCKIVILLTKNL